MLHACLISEKTWQAIFYLPLSPLSPLRGDFQLCVNVNTICDISLCVALRSHVRPLTNTTTLDILDQPLLLTLNHINHFNLDPHPNPNMQVPHPACVAGVHGSQDSHVLSHRGGATQAGAFEQGV